MSTFVGHGLGAVTAYEALRHTCGLRKGWSARALVVVLAMAPDIDVVLGMLWPGVINHRGFTHSLLFAALLAALASPLLVKGSGPRRILGFLGLWVVCALHPLLDYLMACGPPVPLFWPLCDQSYLSPIQLVPTAYYARSMSGLWGLLSHGPTLRAMGLEVLMFLPLAVIASGAARRWGRGWVLAMLLASAVGWLVVYLQYNG